MERRLLLLALSSLLVCSLAQMERQHKVIFSGTLKCGGEPLPGVTLTVQCQDGVKIRTVSRTTDSEGLFSLKYFTDGIKFGNEDMDGLNDATARCTLQSVQPAVMTKKFKCGLTTIEDSCSFTMGPTPMTLDMNLAYAAPNGCAMETPPPGRQSAQQFKPCQVTNRQVFRNGSTIFTVSDRTVPISSNFPVAKVQTEDDCGWACMESEGCAHYSFNCFACTLYKRGAIATTEARIVSENYEVLKGTWVCPETVVGTCNK